MITLWPIYLLLLVAGFVLFLVFDLYFRIRAVLVLDRVIELTGSRRMASLGMVFVPLVNFPATVWVVFKARSMLRSLPADYREEFGERLQRLLPGVLWSFLRILVLVGFVVFLASWIIRSFDLFNIDDHLFFLIMGQVTSVGGLLLFVFPSFMLICGYQFVAQLKLVERIVRSLDIETAGELPRTPPTGFSASVDGPQA